MILFNIKNYYFEYHPNLKHWGKNIEYCNEVTEIVPYYRFYALFIFEGNPNKFIKD